MYIYTITTRNGLTAIATNSKKKAMDSAKDYKDVTGQGIDIQVWKGGKPHFVIKAK